MFLAEYNNIDIIASIVNDLDVKIWGIAGNLKTFDYIDVFMDGEFFLESEDISHMLDNTVFINLNALQHAYQEMIVQSKDINLLNHVKNQLLHANKCLIEKVEASNFDRYALDRLNFNDLNNLSLLFSVMSFLCTTIGILTIYSAESFVKICIGVKLKRIVKEQIKTLNTFLIIKTIFVGTISTLLYHFYFSKFVPAYLAIYVLYALSQIILSTIAANINILYLRSFIFKRGYYEILYK